MGEVGWSVLLVLVRCVWYGAFRLTIEGVATGLGQGSARA